MVPSTVTYNRLNTVKLPVLNHRAAEYQASSSKKSSVNVAYSDEMVWYPESGANNHVARDSDSI